VDVGHEPVNYIRAAAHAVVDAYSGQVSIYAAATADPIMRAWQAAYPGMVLPAADLPAEVRAHLRYPAELYAAQAEAYATYHAEDAAALWNGSDAWAPARQLAGPAEVAGEVRFPDPVGQLDPDERRDGKVSADDWRMAPAYGLARLPGDATEQFMLTAAFTPRGRENLVAYLAGTVDAEGRPALTQLSLPRERLTLGPTQTTRRVLSSDVVVRRLALLNRESRDLGRAAVSRTVLGIPRLVPLDGTLVQVQPLFLTAAGEGLPRLQLVTVFANGRVGYGDTLAAALAQVTSGA
jgi:uncharacterized membrane protein (UPF0182 family)